MARTKRIGLRRQLTDTTMNPLLFADWGRMNRLFTRVMWAVAAVMICVVCFVIAAAGPATHAPPAPHSTAAAASIDSAR